MYIDPCLMPCPEMTMGGFPTRLTALGMAQHRSIEAVESVEWQKGKATDLT